MRPEHPHGVVPPFDHHQDDVLERGLADGHGSRQGVQDPDLDGLRLGRACCAYQQAGRGEDRQ